MKTSRRKQYIERIILICDPEENWKYRQRFYKNGYRIVQSGYYKLDSDRMKFIAEKIINKGEIK